MDGLALGALVAWWVRQGTPRPLFAALSRFWPILLLVGIAAIAILAALRPTEGSPALCAGGYLAISLFFACVVAVVAGIRPPVLNSPLQSRALTQLGRHSYCIYLWHALLGGATTAVLGGPEFRLNSPTALAVAAAAVLCT
jgi:peptidoglycan/LPS O-acetylase OafA/YrhL